MAGEFGAGGHAELPVDACDVRLHGALADCQEIGDLSRRSTCGSKPGDLAFPRCQRLHTDPLRGTPAAAAAGDELLDLSQNGGGVAEPWPVVAAGQHYESRAGDAFGQVGGVVG